MLTEALEFLHKQSEGAIASETIKVGGRTYSMEDWKEIDPSFPPHYFSVSTLTGFVDGVKALTEARKPHMIEVDPQLTVRAYSEPDDRKACRPIVVCEPLLGRLSSIGCRLEPAEFMLRVQTDMDLSPDRERLIKVAGGIREESELSISDDGLSQRVSTKRGATFGWEGIANPYILRPYRTYPEVEQPGSKFILRLSGSGNNLELALHEVLSEGWRTSAIRDIVQFLWGMLEPIPVIG